MDEKVKINFINSSEKECLEFAKKKNKWIWNWW